MIHSAGWSKTVARRIEIEVNGREYPVHSDADTSLLFVLREEIGLTGTKYGCGEGQFGACTVLGGSLGRSCQVPLGDATRTVCAIRSSERTSWGSAALFSKRLILRMAAS